MSPTLTASEARDALRLKLRAAAEDAWDMPWGEWACKHHITNLLRETAAAFADKLEAIAGTERGSNET